MRSILATGVFGNTVVALRNLSETGSVDDSDKVQSSASFYLLRHAESANNKKFHGSGASEISVDRAVCVRDPDPSLSDLGHQQAEDTAAYFKSLLDDKCLDDRYRPGKIVTSCMTRTLQTAAPIVRAFDSAISVRPHLQLHESGGVFDGPRKNRGPEDDYRVLHGLTRDEMKQIIPELEGTEDIGVHGWWSGGMESDEDALGRVEAVVDWMWQQVEMSAKDEPATIMVTHGLFLMRLLQLLLNEDGKASDNCGYFLVQLDILKNGRKRVSVLTENDVSHIPEVHRTVGY